MSSSHGKFVWYDLMTPDPKAAEAFYRGVVGWEAGDAGMPDMPYTLFSVGGAQVGGLMALTPDAVAAGAYPAWMGYVGVDDVDASAAQFAQEGGKIHRAPDDIPGIGRFAVVADPQGAVVSLFRALPGTEAPEAPPGTPGHAGWRELLAADGADAFAFYAKVFGWTKGAGHDMGPMGLYQLFQHGGQDLGGMMTKPPQVPAPFWLYYFNVDGIHPAVERIKAGGGQIANGPMEVPGGQWIVQGLDPQGVMFALVGPRG